MGVSVWIVKGAVEVALKAALIPVTADIVQLGRPVETVPLSSPRRVYIGSVLNDDPQPIWEPGSQIRTEEYVIPLLVDCLSITGNDPVGYATAYGLVQAIVTAIEAQIDADQSWGGVCMNSGLSLSGEDTTVLASAPSGEGWRSSAILGLHVQTKGR